MKERGAGKAGGRRQAADKAARQPARREAINIRMQPQVRELIDRAARLAGKNRTDFVLDAARRAAEDTLLDRTILSGEGEGISTVPGTPGRPAASKQTVTEEHANAGGVGVSSALSSIPAKLHWTSGYGDALCLISLATHPERMWFAHRPISPGDSEGTCQNRFR